MRETSRIAGYLIIVFSIAILPSARAQVVSSDVSSGVPRVIKFSGTLKDATGKLLNGRVGIAFAVYSESVDGTPLWEETQNVEFVQGRYTALLGQTRSTGIPVEIFASGQSRWLGMRILLPGEQEQPRVFLTSVPYALKAGDADSLGGLPAQAFARVTAREGIRQLEESAAVANTSAIGSAPPSNLTVTTPGGTVNVIPKFSSSSTIVDSQIADTNGQVTLQNLENIEFPDHFSGDACAQINSAVRTASPRVYAFAITGNPSCSSNPFSSASVTGGQLFLGSTTYQTTSAWTIAQNWQLIGSGLSSIIQAVSSSASPVVSLSVSGSGAEDTNIKNVVVDCNKQAGIGIQNLNAQELSNIVYTTVKNCPTVGIDLAPTSQNMGVYDSQVLYQTAGSGGASTIPVRINSSGPSRGIHGLTVNANALTTLPNVGILINSQGTYENIHCESVVTCVSVTTNNVVIKNVQCGPNVTNCVSLGAGVQGVILESIGNIANTHILDATNGNTLTSTTDPSGVGWYITGQAGATPGACSNSPNVTCNIMKALRLSPTPLPPSGCMEGTLRTVTNSTTNAWGATVTGGGSFHVLAYCNGTNWTVVGK